MSDKYPHRLLAKTGSIADVTEWEHVFEDVYQCRCCGQRRRLDQLTVVTKGGRL